MEAAAAGRHAEHPNLPHPSVPVGEGRHRERDRPAPKGEPRHVRLRAEAALGPRRRARHHRLRARRQALRHALLRAEGRRRAAPARADRLDARPAHAEARLHRDLPAVHGQGARCWWARATCPSSATTSTATPRRTSGGSRPPRCRSPTCTATRSSTASKLPIKHVAYTPCFRREKMSAGRDVRGIKRGHQFDKVEMVKFVASRDSDGRAATLVDDAEDVCRGLGIPYRIVEMCTGDLSFVAAKKYDIEIWAPGCKEWLEVSSCSQLHRLPGAPREHPLPAASRARSPSSSTRSTARGWRCRA